MSGKHAAIFFAVISCHSCQNYFKGLEFYGNRWVLAIRIILSGKRNGDEIHGNENPLIQPLEVKNGANRDGVKEMEVQSV